MIETIRIETLNSLFEKYYGIIYDLNDKFPNYPEWVDEGDRLLHDEQELVTKLDNFRQDMLTSDREIAAFALAFHTCIPANAARA